MKIIIAGSRTIYSTALVRLAMRESGFEITEIVSGAARGIDQAAIDVAAIDGIPLTIFLADWDKFGKAAGNLRNGEMADYGDGLIAVWDGESTGTGNMITHMGARGKPSHVARTVPE